MADGKECPIIFRIIAAAVEISRDAAKIIRKIKLSGKLDASEKELKQIVTKADIESQICIVSKFKSLFPKLRFCAEEDISKYDAATEKVDLNKHVIKVSNECKNDWSKFNHNEEDLYLWIDPLDGTKEYIQGNEYAHEVTVLIGISYKGRPIAGVVTQPFYSKILSDANGDRVFWGICGVGAYQHRYGDMESIQKIPIPKRCENRDRRIVTTRSHLTDLLKNSLTKTPDSRVDYVGGSGYKVILVIEGTADCYSYPKWGTKRWDTCGPEAILLSLSGRLTDVFNNEYIYSDKESVENCYGVIATSNEHDFYLKYITDELKAEIKREKEEMDSKIKI